MNDPTDAAVPGATVTITNQETGLKRTENRRFRPVQFPAIKARYLFRESGSAGIRVAAE